MTNSESIPNFCLFSAFKEEEFSLVLFFKKMNLRIGKTNIKNAHEIFNASYIFCQISQG